MFVGLFLFELVYCLYRLARSFSLHSPQQLFQHRSNKSLSTLLAIISVLIQFSSQAICTKVYFVLFRERSWDRMFERESSWETEAWSYRAWPLITAAPTLVKRPTPSAEDLLTVSIWTSNVSHCLGRFKKKKCRSEWEIAKFPMLYILGKYSNSVHIYFEGQYRQKRCMAG